MIASLCLLSGWPLALYFYRKLRFDRWRSLWFIVAVGKDGNDLYVWILVFDLLWHGLWARDARPYQRIVYIFLSNVPVLNTVIILT
jgi:hypothetical protein